MGIKRSTFYYQVKENRTKEQQEAFLKEKIQKISYQHPYYGYRRIKAQLKRENITINYKRVLRMMRQMVIQARIKHRYTTTTHSRHHNRVYPNLFKIFFQPVSIRSGVVISPISTSSLALFNWLPLLISIPVRLSAMR